jgi:hypothetical protein
MLGLIEVKIVITLRLCEVRVIMTLSKCHTHNRVLFTVIAINLNHLNHFSFGPNSFCASGVIMKLCKQL